MNGISDDLRYLALRCYDPTVVPGLKTFLVWDRTTGTGRVALQLQSTGQPGQPQLGFHAVTPGGSLLATQYSTNVGDVLESHPTAGVRTVASSATRLSPQLSWMVSTSDGRTVIFSQQSLLGQQLVAQRCA